MSLFPATFIDDLRNRADIVRIVQDYVPLKKAGNTWKGLCPFHGEKTPSFHVNPDKGFFYCFGCQASGDAITFVREVERLDFAEAVERLAARAGITLRYDDKNVGKDEMDFEIEFARGDGNSGLDKFHLHIRCFAAWEFECRNAGEQPR